MTRGTVLFGLCLALVAALAYGSNVPFAKLSAQAGVPGPDIILYRALLMLVVLAPVIWLGGGSLRLPAAARRSVLGLGIATACVGLCYISSVAFVPVGVATLIFYTFPLLILVMSPLVDGQPVTLRRIAIFCLAFAGLLIAIGPVFAALDPRGLALAALAALGGAAQFFFAARATRLVEPAVAGFWTQAILTPVALAVCLTAGGPVGLSALAAAAVPVGLTCGLFVVAFGLHLSSARLAPPAALGLIFCAEPVTSTLLAALVLDERLTPAQFVGGALVLAAIVAAVMVEGRERGPVPG